MEESIMDKGVNISNIIIIPGQNDTKELFGTLVGVKTQIQIAMMRFPETLTEPFGGVPKEGEERQVLWVLKTRQDDEVDGFELSQYEFHGIEITPETKKVDSVMDLDTQKNGYVYLPKDLRDGRHEDAYIIMDIPRDEFEYKVGRGMYEEVCWSPFGYATEAVKQEAANLERNPKLRRWKHL
jgi:hypothetical protein